MKPITVAALDYLTRGLAAVPCCVPVDGSPSGCSASWHAMRKGHKAGKTPIVAWSAYQTSLPTDAEWQTWDRRFARYNVGFITGAVSRRIVLDLDSGHADGVDGSATLRSHGLHLPPSPTVRTRHGGLHVHLLHPGGDLRNFAGRLPGVDARGDGGFALLPPSENYEWLPGLGPDDVEPAPAPGWLIDLFGPARDDTAKRREPKADDIARLLYAGAPPGARHAAVVSVAGYLRAYGVPPAVVAAVLETWNAARGVSPAPEDAAALRATAEDVCARYGDRGAAVTRLARHLLRRHVDPYMALELIRAWDAVHGDPPMADADLLAAVEAVAEQELARRGVGA